MSGEIDRNDHCDRSCGKEGMVPASFPQMPDKRNQPTKPKQRDELKIEWAGESGQEILDSKIEEKECEPKRSDDRAKDAGEDQD